MGAPVKVDRDRTWPKIIEAIANGQSLSAILRQPNMPSYSWAKLQLRQDQTLKQLYEQAVEDRADLLAEEIEHLADEEIPAGLDGPSKSAWIQRQRLRVDTRKWAASKLRPRVYGDRIDVSVTAERISINGALDEAHQRLIEQRAIDGEVTAFDTE